MNRAPSTLLLLEVLVCKIPTLRLGWRHSRRRKSWEQHGQDDEEIAEVFGHKSIQEDVDQNAGEHRALCKSTAVPIGLSQHKCAPANEILESRRSARHNCDYDSYLNRCQDTSQMRRIKKGNGVWCDCKKLRHSAPEVPALRRARSREALLTPLPRRNASSHLPAWIRTHTRRRTKKNC